ncbi:hypothetical protein F2P56_025551 [Juglans regia]|uniref:ZF-HD dimerization-type domain-containing protein n=2 Tax=Juglans regia TaxID=51240 RepID=A0A833TU66_JUGRE|nr:zinc-finger homeodomain protein 2 [Juglans regia]KAF5456036.1 hypothetical protein F2P56_025551 [Juglans regia]
MEFDEHEEQEEDMMEIPTPPPGYESVSNSARPKMGSSVGEEIRTGGGNTTIRYRECLKNHAVSIGGHAVDGCGEFLAAGDEGTLDALKCAACNCHRNFHRKETNGSSEAVLYHHHHQISPYYRTSAPPPPQTGYHLRLTTPSQHHRHPLALPAASGGGGGAHSREGEDMSNPSSSGGGGGSSGSKKRFRTKFTQEQREKMLAFAESLGWRIQKHDEAAVEQFCADTGVRRNVLKVWMHNNKHTLGKKP